jgi:N-acetylglucosaminyl-diphospho-decaprenol L-rhamnosyltransferase
VPAGPAVSMVVVSWNTRELLARCLEAARPEVESGRLAVHVVDNASADGSAELVRERFDWARLEGHSENLGFGRAANLGAAAAQAAWVAVANADTALRPGALDLLLEAGRRDPAAAVVAPRLVLPDGSTQHSVYGFPTLPYAALLNSGLHHLSRDLADRLAVPDRWDSARARRVPWAIGAFLLVRRQAWDEVGGFDPDQFMYAEDLDLGWRLRSRGWFTRYEPRAVVDHHGGAATEQVWGRDPFARYWASTYGWMARRRGAARAWGVAAMNTTGAALRYAVATPLARVAPDPWAERRRGLAHAAKTHAGGLASRSTLERRR